jgi:dihydrofolate synthase / folylpolyglutamate synthase
VDYNQTLQFLYSQYPAFEKQGGLAYKPGLENVLGISAAFNNPHKKFKSIHVAGTNGKGSCSSMLASILQSAGYKVGLYTSPHIHDFTERIRINGTCIPQSEVVNFVSLHTNVFNQFNPSFFEITTILAFDWFAKNEVDIAIIETGMGGRLDATNVIQPEVSLITNVSLDHTQFLGTTVSAIAAEKAGIIKEYTPVVLSEFQEEIYTIFKSRAVQLNAPFISAFELYDTLLNTDFTVDIRNRSTGTLTNIDIDLKGMYQCKNIIGVLAVVDVLRNLNWNVDDVHIQEGLSHVQVLSGFKGRWQVVSQAPMIILDAAHNEAGMTLSMQQLQLLNKKMYIVIGMVKDKDVSNILSLLPVTATYYFCEATNPRSLAAEELKNRATQYNLKGDVMPNVNDALHVAKLNAATNDVIWVGGSLYVLGELLLN